MCECVRVSVCEFVCVCLCVCVCVCQVGEVCGRSRIGEVLSTVGEVECFNTLRPGSFKLFKGPFPGFLTILTL